MRSVSDRERREADLFLADLTGRPRRARPQTSRGGETMAAPQPLSIAAESSDESLVDDAIDPARLFDEVVYRGADPTPFMGEGDQGRDWEVVALPFSSVSPEVFREGQLVVSRSLGEDRLACVQVLGEDIQVADLYGSGLRLRGDVVVLGQQPSAAPAPSLPEPESMEGWASTSVEGLEDSDMLHPIPEEDAEDESTPEWERAETSDVADALEVLERVEVEVDGEDVENVSTAPRRGVSIEAAAGLGTSGTTAPIATVSPQRQMNEVLDRELILFAKARIVAEWVDKNLTATFEQAFADTALRARLDVSRDSKLLDRIRPFPSRQIPDRRAQLFTTDAVLQNLLKAPADIAGLWPIFDVLHHYGVVLLPPDPGNPFGRPSIMASITRVEARLDRARFDRESKAVEEKAVKFKKAVANKGVLHHAVESDVIPADWSAGTKGQILRVAKPVIQLLARLRALNTTWRAGTYPGHWWNDFSVDMFVSAALEKSGFWNRDRMRAFFEALNAACTQDGAPGKFAWKGIYNDAGLAQEMDGLYGAGRVLSGVEGHGPGPRMHVHLDVRPLVVPFDETTGFWLDGSRVVLTQPPPRPALPSPSAAPIAPSVRTREEEDEEDEEDTGAGEAVPLGGRGKLRHAPLGGDGDNVEARFNIDAATPAGATIDVVVYLHGYGARAEDFLARKAATAGVDLVDAGGKVKVRASRPTLVLVPRGRHTSASRWVFDALANAASFNALVDAGLSWLHRSVVRSTGAPFTRGRLTLMAHSGGGAGLSALLQNGLDPDEVVCFDSLYGGEDSIRKWAEAKIASPQAAQSGLRAFYTGCSAPAAKYPVGRWIAKDGGGHTYDAPGSWLFWTSDNKWHLISTEVAARRLQHGIDRALGSGKTDLRSRFRVEQTSVGHNDIPAQYSPLLLDDIAANVPKATPAPPSTKRPVCVANDDWLTRLPQKPGGDDPPPPKP